jgi:hypothetical protein
MWWHVPFMKFPWWWRSMAPKKGGDLFPTQSIVVPKQLVMTVYLKNLLALISHECRLPINMTIWFQNHIQSDLESSATIAYLFVLCMRATLCCHTFSVYYLLRCAVICISSWFSVENLYVLIGVLVLFHLTLGLTPPLATNQSPERRSIQILLASSAKHKATYGKPGYANIMEVLSTFASSAAILYSNSCPK